jgi:hypothetical protein
MTKTRNRRSRKASQAPPNRGQGQRSRGGQALGVYDATLNQDGTVLAIPVSFNRLPLLRALGAGKHEFRITSLTATITVATRLNNDGEVVAQLLPKNWQPESAAMMKTQNASFRYISSAPWSVSLASSGEWVAVSNFNVTMFMAGFALEKDTQVSVLFRGNVQFR